MARKTKSIVLLVALNVILMLLCVILIFRSCSREKEYQHADSAGEVTQINEFKEVTDFETVKGQKVVLGDSKYTVRPGYTFYTDKGSMKLFVDITPADEGKVLRITGKEYHNEQGYDVEMTDAAIDDTFILDLTTGEYVNTNQDMTVKYDGLTATFTDTRRVALKFSGTLELIRSIYTDGDSDANQLNPSDIVSYNAATEIPPQQVSSGDIDKFKLSSETVGELKTDEYYTGPYPSSGTSEFASQLTPSNERKKITITAKYIQSTSNSGTKFQEIHSGIYFYAFGQAYPYDPSQCNVITLTAMYRGNEQHFNGLQMDGEYPCFVIDSIRKVTADEIN